MKDKELEKAIIKYTGIDLKILQKFMNEIKNKLLKELEEKEGK